EGDRAVLAGGVEGVDRVVARVAVREGEEVRRGQVLAALDATELAAGVRQAREGATKARRDRDRARLLRAGGSIALAQAEDAETGAAVAEAALAAAEFNLRHAVLVAPDDGWVDRRQIEPGEVVATGRTVLRVSGRSHGFVVRAALPERDVLGLTLGGAAVVRLDARPDQALPGRLTEISRAAAKGTGTWLVEVRLDRPPRDLLSGLGAKLELARAVAAAGTVPLAALQEGDGARGAVYVVEGARARRVPVRVAFLEGDRAVLAGGVEGVDRVVADGAALLADGAAVKPVP
ncbi:MAG TPA: efflux RND transporter periplasmic adaptor subunit, partial [Anaeromyxobacteraceae bacterium]